MKRKKIHIGWHTQYLGSVAVFILLAPPLLCSCFFTTWRTEMVELPRPTSLPTEATDKGPATNALRISWTSPHDVRKNPWISEAFENTSSIYEKRRLVFLPYGNAAVWVDDALFESVKKAGYNLERVDSLAAANTPVVITVELIEMSCGPSNGFLSPISEKIVVRILISKSGQVLSDNSYDATSFEGQTMGLWEAQLTGLQCHDADAVAVLSQKALEKLLAKAVPSLLTVLHAATLPANAAASASHQPAQ